MSNKENELPLGPSSANLSYGSDTTKIKILQNDIIRLERLYSEQVLKTQTTLNDQERLENDLLDRENLILEQRGNLNKMGEQHKSLKEKLQDEVNYYESEIENHKRLERELLSNSNKLKLENERILNLLKNKDEEILNLNEELDTIMNDLDSKRDEIESMNALFVQQSNDSNIILEESDDEDIVHKGFGDLTFDDSFDDERFNDMLIADEPQDSDDFDEHLELPDNTSSLANEISDRLDEREKLLKKYQFEVKSLRNEKVQLYNYINKLLRNPKLPNQNNVLKQKLVTRKILRSSSISNLKVNDASLNKLSVHKNPQSKRVISNYVNFKEYRTIAGGNKKWSKVRKQQPNFSYANSDDEREEDDRLDGIELEYERWLLGYSGVGHRLMLGIRSSRLSKATNVLLPEVEDDSDEWEDVVEEEID